MQSTYPGTSNKLTSVAGLYPQTNSYDAMGNQTADGTHTYTYDARRRMGTSVTGGVTTTYRLNGLGQRTRKTEPGLPGGWREFFYDNEGHLLGEYDYTGAALQETAWLGDTPIAVNIGAAHYFVAPDHLDAPRTIGYPTGAFVWTWDRDPFGITQPTKAGWFPDYNLRFPGQYYDNETGLSYNMNRNYNPQLGRYVESDPIGLNGGINTYGYVGQNPVAWIDFLGLAPGDPYPTPDAAAIAAIRDIYGKSMREGLEYGGRVYKKDGYYSYTSPRQGTPISSNAGFCPVDTENRGYYHTHPQVLDYNPEIFSPEDMSLSYQEGQPGYVGTASGKIKKYTPKPPIPKP